MINIITCHGEMIYHFYYWIKCFKKNIILMSLNFADENIKKLILLVCYKIYKDKERKAIEILSIL